MGIDVFCGNEMMRCGSYSSLPQIYYHLLSGIKFYLEIMFPEDEKKIHYLCQLLNKKNTIQWDILNFQKLSNLGEYSLDGFNSFIFHSMEGPISSDNIDLFLDTWDLVEDYIDSSIKNKERKFFLNDIFQKSKQSREPVTFS